MDTRHVPGIISTRNGLVKQRLPRAVSDNSVDVRVDSPGIEPSLDITPRLIIHFPIHTTYDLLVDDFYTRGGVVASETGGQLGLPTFSIPPVSDFRVESSGSHELVANLDLNYRQLDKIEELRDGEDLKLNLTVSMKVRVNGSNSSPSYFKTDIDKRISKSDWARVLRQLDYRNSRIIKFDLSTHSTAGHDLLENAIAHLERAQQQSEMGNHDDAVTQCRRALEKIDSLDEEVDIGGYIGEKKWNDRIRDNQFFDKFRKSYLGLMAHTPEETGAEEDALSPDSEFAIGVTSAIIRYVSRGLSEQDH